MCPLNMRLASRPQPNRGFSLMRAEVKAQMSTRAAQDGGRRGRSDWNRPPWAQPNMSHGVARVWMTTRTMPAIAAGRPSHTTRPSTAALISRAAVLGLVVWLGRPAAIAGMVLVVIQTLATPWLMFGWAQGGLFQSLRPRLPPSWAARVDIWAFTSARMSEKPLFGWRPGPSRTGASRSCARR